MYRERRKFLEEKQGQKVRENEWVKDKKEIGEFLILDGIFILILPSVSFSSFFLSFFLLFSLKLWILEKKVSPRLNRLAWYSPFPCSPFLCMFPWYISTTPLTTDPKPFFFQSFPSFHFILSLSHFILLIFLSLIDFSLPRFLCPNIQFSSSRASFWSRFLLFHNLLFWWKRITFLLTES